MSSSNLSPYLHKNPLRIQNTNESYSLDTGAFVVNGGASINKNLHIGGSSTLYGSSSGHITIKASDNSSNYTLTLPASNPTTPNQFLVSDVSGNLTFSPGNATDFSYTGSQNVISPSDITGLIFSSGNFEINITVNIIADTNLSQLYKLTGLLSNGGSGWNLTAIAISGDNTNIQFYITPAGQIQYTSVDYLDFVSLTFLWTNFSPSSSVININTGVSTSKVLQPNNGAVFNVNPCTITDTGTAPSGFLSDFNSIYISRPTLSSLNAGVTTTNCNTMFIEGDPITGSNETITNKFSLNVNSGNVRFGSNLQVIGNMSKGSGTFDIQHPLSDNPKNRLFHSFIEGPRCDNVYRGTTTLNNGMSFINLDTDCVSSIECSMKPGTFAALNKNPIYLLQNDTTFDRVKAKFKGNLLIITCENNQSSDVIHWVVIAERQDTFIKESDITNSEGSLITEYTRF